MGLHELIIDGVSSANYGAYVCGGGTWKTPKRKGNSVNVSGRNGNLWIDGDAWEDVPIKYDIILNNNNAEILDAFTSWLAFMSRGQHRIEDTLHERYYRIGRVNCSVTPKVVEKWNSSKFSVEIICRPEKFLKQGNEPFIFAPIGHCYVSYENMHYWLTTDPDAPLARAAWCGTLMYKKPLSNEPTYVDAYFYGLNEGDRVYMSRDQVGTSWTGHDGETMRFTSEPAYAVTPDDNGHVRYAIAPTAGTANFCVYRFAVVSDSMNISMRIEDTNYFADLSTDDYGSHTGEEFAKTIYTDNLFATRPLIKIHGWAFNIAINGVVLVGKDYRTARGWDIDTPAWKSSPPVDFYIDCDSKEIYYIDTDGTIYDYNEHTSLLVTRDGGITWTVAPTFPALKGVDAIGDNVAQGVSAALQDYNGIKDFLFSSISITPRYFEI